MPNKDNSYWNISPALSYLCSKWRIYNRIVCVVLLATVILFTFIIKPKYESTCIIAPIVSETLEEPAKTELGYKIPFEEQTQLILEVISSNKMKSLIIKEYPEINFRNLHFGRTENYQVFIKVKDKTQGEASNIANFIAEQYNLLAEQDATHTIPQSLVISAADINYETSAGPSKIKIYVSSILLTIIVVSGVLLVNKKE